jgi:hypothetical protein
MPNGQVPNDYAGKYLSVNQVAEEIREAWMSGRPIVPLIGAGASATAGIPTIRTLLRYLAKVHATVSNMYFLPKEASERINEFCKKTYGASISRFVEDYGWPDRFELTADLLTACQDEFHNEINKSFNELARAMNPEGHSYLEKIVDTAKGATTVGKLAPQLRDAVMLDWRPLLRHVTSYQQELADSLFTQMHVRRKPATFHRYLAHLSKLLGIRAIFTSNFDPLIERALSDESILHQPFAMEFGGSLPAPVLAAHLAVIKMHGSTHHLLMDERLDYPLDEAYKLRFQEFVGPNPLLIVIGCSGNDRRLRDLVDVVDDKQDKDKQDASPIRTIWTQYLTAGEENYRSPEQSVKHLNSLKFCQLRDVGAFLSHIYTHITSRLPAARLPYSAHVVRTWPSASDAEGSKYYESREAQFYTGEDLHDVILINGMSTEDDTGNSSELNSTCELLHKYVACLPMHYSLIYIDLEEHHSLGAVVSEIINQARESDTALTPLRLPVEAAKQHPGTIDITTAARRVAQALQRTRIALVFDSIDAFSWRTTTHHGQTTSLDASEIDARDTSQSIKELRDFLKALVEEHRSTPVPGGSVICISINLPIVRHPGDFQEEEQVQKLRTVLQGTATQLIEAGALSVPTEKIAEPTTSSHLKTLKTAVKNVDFTQPINPDILYARLLCTIRRSRLLPMLRHFYVDLKDGRTQSHADKEISTLTRNGILTPLEGGAYSMGRPDRNELYAQSTHGGSRDVVALQIGRSAVSTEWPLDETVAHLIDGAAIHDYCARYYYNYAYLPSNDPFTFLEYVYHRISGTRYLVDLILIVNTDGKKHNNSESAVSWTQKYFQHLKSDGNQKLLKTVYHCFEKTIKCLCPGDTAFDGRASTGRMKLPALNRELQDLHKMHLRGLVNAWKRSDTMLREKVSPELLLSWCREILQYDLEYNSVGNLSLSGRWQRLSNRRTTLMVRNGRKNSQQPMPTQEDNFQLPTTIGEAAQNELDDLKAAVIATEVRCLYERGAFEILLNRRIDFINNLFQQNNSPGKTSTTFDTSRLPKLLASLAEKVLASDENIKKQAIHPLLDALISAHWSIYARGQEVSQSNVKTRIRIEKAVKALLDSSVLKDSEAEFRWNYIQIEHALSQVETIGRCAFPNLTATSASNNSDELKDLIGEAITQIDRVHDDLQAESVAPVAETQNPVLNPTVDRTLLIPYRALFRILKGRATTQSLVLSPPESGNKFISAYRDFELARASIGPENNALLTFCELCAAETANINANYYFRKHCQKSPSDGDHGEPSTGSKMWAKIRSAQTYLEHANRSMGQGGRHVLLWRYLSLASARTNVYLLISKVDQIAPTFARSDEQLGVKSDAQWRTAAKLLGGVVGAVRNGLHALRDGMDHTPRDAERFWAEYFELWHELLICGMANAVLIAQKISKESPIAHHKEIGRWWRDLNRRVGIKGSYVDTSHKLLIDNIFHEFSNALSSETDPLRTIESFLSKMHCGKKEEGLLSKWWNSNQAAWLDTAGFSKA